MILINFTICSFCEAIFNAYLEKKKICVFFLSDQYDQTAFDEYKQAFYLLL